MTNWYYYNEQGEKIAVTGGQLKGLAKAGLITPDTIVETEEGKSAPARKVKGLTFAETVQSETVPPIETNPFTATPSETVNPSVTPAPVPKTFVENVRPFLKKVVEWSKETYQKAKPHVIAWFENIRQGSKAIPPDTNPLQETALPSSSASSGEQCATPYTAGVIKGSNGMWLLIKGWQKILPIPLPYLIPITLFLLLCTGIWIYQDIIVPVQEWQSQQMAAPTRNTPELNYREYTNEERIERMKNETEEEKKRKDELSRRSGYAESF